jgi:para-nitrobenzyl esterase
MAKGLFQRAISESGGAVAPTRGSLKMAEDQGKDFLSKLGANDIKAARALSAEKVQEGLKGAAMSFWPVADGVTILENPYQLFEAGTFNNTPVMIGTNSHEGRLFSNRITPSSTFEQMIRKNYGTDAELFLKAYPHAMEAEATRSAQDILRESIFAWPSWAWAKLQAKTGKNKVFMYYFDHRTATMPDGSDHASEISYVFGNLGGFGGSSGTEDKALSDLMNSYWVNFAKTGDPNGKGLPPWPTFDDKLQKTMIFDKTPGAKQHPNLDKLNAFDGYFAKQRESAKAKK